MAEAIPYREAVTWAYRLFLGREPEDQTNVEQFAHNGDMASLRRQFLSSEEFADTYKSIVGGSSLTTLPGTWSSVEVDASAGDFKKILDHIQKTWTRLGTEAPHWSVLSSEEFKPHNIDRNEGSFFQSGAADVAAITDVMRRSAIEIDAVQNVFEYGCGLGRVTVFLAKTFRHVTACDISSSHLQAAKANVAKAGLHNVKFTIASNEKFGMVDKFDLWFSRIVLQHNPPPIIKSILLTALDRLMPGGIAIFQLPTYHHRYSFSSKNYITSLHSGEGEIEMHCFPQREVFRISKDCSCDVLEVMEDNDVGVPGWRSNTFVLQKRR